MCACTLTYKYDQQQNHGHRISVDLQDFYTSIDDVHTALKIIKQKLIFICE